MRYLLIFVAISAIAGCGGSASTGNSGSSDAGSDASARDRSAPLDNAEQAMKLAKALTIAMSIESGEMESALNGFEIPNLNYSGATISNSTFNCEDNSSILINENGADLSGESTRCTDLENSAGFSYRLDFSGNLAIECDSTPSSNGVCPAGDVLLGSGGESMVVAITEVEDGETFNIRDEYLGAGSLASTGVETLNYVHNYSSNSFTESLLFVNATQQATLGSDADEVRHDIAGQIGVSTNLTNCNNGTVTVASGSSFTVDESGDEDVVTAGTLNLSNSEGQQATINITANGGASVTVNGQSTTFTESQINQFCRF